MPINTLERVADFNRPLISEVLVFATSVESKAQVRALTPILDSFVGAGRWNFALDDSDRILRIVSEGVEPIDAVNLLHECGFECKELED